MNNKSLQAFFVFLFTFIVYVLTLNPELSFTDSGELAGVLSTLGIAHPSGYPLFTMLGYLWSKIPLPFSNIYQLNLFAAFLTSSSIAVFYFVADLILQKIKSKISTEDTQIISLISALTLGFASVIWMQAVAVEVYSLHLLMINLVLYFTIKAYFENSQKNYLIAALFLGLSFANHLTTILLVPALIFLFFLKENKFDFSQKKLKSFAMLFIPILLGISLYLYLPLRSASDPLFNWGDVSRGWDKFMYHFSGKQYQVWMFAGKDAWKENFSEFVSLIPYQLAFVGIIIYGIGIFHLFRKHKQLTIFVNLLFFTCIFYAFNYSIHDIENYFILAYLAMILFVAVGLVYIAEKYKVNKYAFLLLPFLALVSNYATNDQSNNYAVSEYTNILTDNLEPNAIIISAQWDFYCSAFWYKQQVEGYRKDIIMVEKELLRRTWYPQQMTSWYPELSSAIQPEINSFMEQLELFEAEKPYNNIEIQTRFMALLNSIVDKFYGKRPIYITYDMLQTEKGFAPDYKKIPTGIAFKLEKEDRVIVPNYSKLNFDKFIKSLEGKNDHLSIGIRESAALGLVNVGRYMQYMNHPEYKKAYELSLKIQPNNEWALQGLGR